MAFPTTLDTTTTIPVEASSTALSTNHVTNHTAMQTAIIAAETKIGVDGSAVTTSHDYKLSGVTGSDKAVSKTGTETLTNKTLTSPVLNVGSDATGDIYYRNAGVLTRLAASTNGFILKLASGLPSWVAETTTVNASTTVAGIVEEATQTEMNAGTATGGTGARLFVSPSTIYNKIKFGGTGADGALSISSGNTNIDMAGAAFFVKNYTSISITGTGSVTFINPHANGSFIAIKSQGDITLTSSASPMLDASGCGTSGGAGGINGSSTAGNNISASFVIYSTGAAGGANAVAGANATGGSLPVNNTFYGFALRATTLGNERLPILLVPGAGGSGGSNNQASGNNGGAGSNGGGALYIECAGSWNFTTANGISVAGKNGIAGSDATNIVGGGGGGGAGTFLALYNTLTSNSGTVNVSAGSGGAVDNTGVGAAYGGAGGASIGASGSNGSSGNGGAGGTAITNAALVLQNTSIA